MRDVNTIRLNREMIDRISKLEEAAGEILDHRGEGDSSRVCYQDECWDVSATWDDGGNVTVAVTYYGPLTTEGIVGYG